MEDGDSPPLWQPPATITRRHKHQPSSPFLNSSLIIIIILPSLCLLFIAFILLPSIPKTVLKQHPKPNTPQMPNHISVKKSWDTLNILLVLFAILCGVFARRNEDVATSSNDQQEAEVHSSSTSIATSNVQLLQRSKSLHHHTIVSAPQWFDYTQQRIPSPSPPANIVATGISPLRPAVSLDPYMRDTSTTDRFRFFQDFDPNRFYPSPEPVFVPPTSPPDAENTCDTDETTVEETPVVLETEDELLSMIKSPPPTPPRNSTPPSTPPPPPKQMRTFETLPRKEQKQQTPTPTDSPPSPPPPPPVNASPRRTEKKKKSPRNATKGIATAIVSLYGHRKGKRKQKFNKNESNDDNRNLQPIQPQQFTPTPLLPPPSVFHNIFRKGSKSKKIHSLSSVNTPPTPKPSKHQTKAEYSGGKPPLGPKRGERVKEAPGRVIEWAAYKVEGGDGGSPDVNRKAEMFIARHHNDWRLENINSCPPKSHPRRS